MTVSISGCFRNYLIPSALVWSAYLNAEFPFSFLGKRLAQPKFWKRPTFFDIFLYSYNSLFIFSPSHSALLSPKSLCNECFSFALRPFSPDPLIHPKCCMFIYIININFSVSQSKYSIHSVHMLTDKNQEVSNLTKWINSSVRKTIALLAFPQKCLLFKKQQGVLFLRPDGFPIRRNSNTI